MNLKNGEIEIRNAIPKDAGLLAEWWNDGKVMAHAGFPLGLGTTEEEVRAKIETESDETTRRHIIVYQGIPIGEMNYRNLGNNECEIGIKICDPDMQNKGLGKKILRMFIRGLFDELGYNVIKLDTNLENKRAQHVYEELGFRRIRVNIDSWKDQLGRLQSSVDYEMRRGEMEKVYLYGQILGTHSFLLKDGFLQPDEYSEIKEQYFLPGGETGTAATVLASLGVSVKMDGTWIGTAVAPMLKDFYSGKSVDLSSIYFWEDDPGVMDYVVIAGLVRSPMGRFQTLFSSGKRWWNVPREEDISDAKAASIDPFFGVESLLAARLCQKHGVPFVTIDCPHTSELHRLAAVNVVSKECTSQHYAGMDADAIMELLKESSDGLTIITQGGGDMLYARKGGKIRRMKPFDVEVKSTLGAGDTFKAGCTYALLKGMSDEETVRFASACSAIAISRFPLPLNPPKLAEVNEICRSR